MFHTISTNEVPVTILKAYVSLPRHIRKGKFMRQHIASDLCNTAVIARNLAKNRENVKEELGLNVTISFSVIVCCLVVE